MPPEDGNYQPVRLIYEICTGNCNPGGRAPGSNLGDFCFAAQDIVVGSYRAAIQEPKTCIASNGDCGLGHLVRVTDPRGRTMLFADMVYTNGHKVRKLPENPTDIVTNAREYLPKCWFPREEPGRG